MAQLLAVHSPAHVELIERLCAAGGGQIDADTVVSSGSWEAALHAAGAGCQLVDRLLDGGSRHGFAALRPPGHHAERGRAMGFCLFNNIAVAAQHALDVRGLTRVMVLDWDVHHGNGTNDIFAATPSVFYVSIHERPLYPGTGPGTDRGSGPGHGFTANLPVPTESGDSVFCSLVEHVVMDLARSYQPQLLLVSAGYDAHREDPLAGCLVSDEGFAAMTALMRALAGELDVGLGFMLEGGYALDALSRSVAATLETLAAPQLPPMGPRTVHPLAAQARKRLGLAPI
jgi:acetoin utilization deacetylase AcuC-like enzyme